MLFQDLGWTVRDHAVTALLGPSATGKSTLLQALAGRLGSSWTRRGRWVHKGRELPASVEEAPRDIAWCPQHTHHWGRAMRRDLVRPLTVPEALASDGSTLLLDEPTVGASEAERAELPPLLRERARSSGVVIVTHDLAFAREVAEDVALLVAGRLDVVADSATFFERPPTPLANQFLRLGTCWPPPRPPALPSHFRWILPDQLAGMGRPGLLNDTEEDLSALVNAGVSLLVSLTEDPFPADQLRAFGLSGRHFPIRDMDVPALGPTARLCAEIERALAAGQRVVVHCRAGLGRTGLVLASYLVWIGRSPQEAVDEVRAQGRGSIQTKPQADFVARFAESIPPVTEKRPS